jgi:hypothetical protein
MKQETKTRWNSQYYAISRLIEDKDALMLTLPEIDDLPDITNDDWQIMKNMLVLLAPLEGATRTLCGAEYASSSMIIPTIRACLNELKRVVITSRQVLLLRATLISNLSDRFDAEEANNLTSVASLLDPRFKEAAFNKIENCNYAKENLKKLMSELGLETITAKQSKDTSTHNAKKNEENSFDILSLIQSDINSRAKCQTRESRSTEDELNDYLGEPNLNITHNVFEWWHSKKNYYPKLFKLAMSYLIIPATSAPSERVFSIAGYLLNGKRNRLSNEHLNTLIFLHSNLNSK